MVNNPLENPLIREKLDEVIFFIAINFWWVFLLFAVIFFLLSIKLFKDKALLKYKLMQFNKAFLELAKKGKVGEIEEFIIKNRSIFGLDEIALYIRRGDIFVLEVASNEGKVGIKNRLYRKDITPHTKIGNFNVYYIESVDGQALLAAFSRKELELEEIEGFLRLFLSYYTKSFLLLEEYSVSNVSNASKEVFSSMMRFQSGTETFLKFVISLLLKVEGTTGIILLNREKPNKIKVFKDPKKGKYKKRFYIRNTPYIMDIFTLQPLTKEQISEIGSFLDMAGIYFEHINENSKMVTNYIHFLRLSNRALELQSPYFKNHSKKVQIVAVEVAKNLFLDEHSIDTISLGAELHDIGMVGKIESFLDSKTINKKELDLIKYHPIVGSVIVEPISNIYNIAPIVKYHHERFDGSGYPFGLKGKDIPIHAQIVALAEYYVGMTSPRAYREAFSHEAALEDIHAQKNKLVEAQIIQAFLDASDGIRKKLEVLDAE